MSFRKRIALSSGHGLSSRIKGKVDPGAIGFGEKEAAKTKAMCDNLSKDFARLNWRVLFRDTGYFSMADDEARKFDASVFLELHLDAAGASANGSGCFVASRTNGKETTLANNILNGIVRVGFRDRGVKKTDDLSVLRQYSGMDSVLVEMAFITNARDNARYDANTEKIELAILNGVLKTYGLKQRTTLPRKWSNLRAYLYRITHR